MVVNKEIGGMVTDQYMIMRMVKNIGFELSNSLNLQEKLEMCFT